MKSLLIAFLFFVPFCSIAQSQKPIDGVLGVKLGSTSETAVAALAVKGIKLDTINSTRATYIFRNIDQGKWKNVTLYLKLQSDKVHEIVFAYIYGFTPQNVIQNYNDLIKEISKTYGQGKSTRIFAKPFFDGDRHELEAIESSRAKYATLWTGSNGNTIELTIFPTFTLLLTYHNSEF